MIVTDDTQHPEQGTVQGDMPAAARRALAEAEARRKGAQQAEPPTELGGRNGPDPVRFGDWEKKGIAIDF